jgi:hypothetical protein
MYCFIFSGPILPLPFLLTFTVFLINGLFLNIVLLKFFDHVLDIPIHLEQGYQRIGGRLKLTIFTELMALGS